MPQLFDMAIGNDNNISHVLCGMFIHNMAILNQLQSEDLKIYLHKISQYVYTATSRIRLDVCKLNVKSQPHVLKFDTA